MNGLLYLIQKLQSKEHLIRSISPLESPKHCLQWKGLGKNRNIGGYCFTSELFAFMGRLSSHPNILRSLAFPHLNLDGGNSDYEVYFNGELIRHTPPEFTYLKAAYVDHLYEDLTVLETLIFSAELRGSNQSSNPSKDGAFRHSPDYYNQISELRALKLLTEMRLKGIGDMKISSLPLWQKRLILIATEVIAHREIIFFPSPTKDLDALSALEMMRSLQRIATEGCIVLITASDLSFREYCILDRIQLLSNTGALYFGLGAGAMSYFEVLGRTPPPGTSVPDFLVDLVDDCWSNHESNVMESLCSYFGHKWKSYHPSREADPISDLPRRPSLTNVSPTNKDIWIHFDDKRINEKKDSDSFPSIDLSSITPFSATSFPTVEVYGQSTHGESCTSLNEQDMNQLSSRASQQRKEMVDNRVIGTNLSSSSLASPSATSSSSSSSSLIKSEPMGSTSTVSLSSSTSRLFPVYDESSSPAHDSSAAVTISSLQTPSIAGVVGNKQRHGSLSSTKESNGPNNNSNCSNNENNNNSEFSREKSREIPHRSLSASSLLSSSQKNTSFSPASTLHINSPFESTYSESHEITPSYSFRSTSASTTSSSSSSNRSSRNSKNNGRNRLPVDQWFMSCDCLESEESLPCWDVSWLKELRWLAWRAFVVRCRRMEDVLAVWLLSGVFVSMGLSLAFFRLSNDFLAVEDKLAFLTILPFAILLLASLGNPNDVKDRHVFIFERHRDYYSTWFFLWWSLISDLVMYRLVPPLLAGSVLYPLVGLSSRGWQPFVIFLQSLVMMSIIGGCQAKVLFALMSTLPAFTPLRASMVTSFVLCMQVLYTGVLANLTKIHGIAGFLKNASFFYWGCNILYWNEMKGCELTNIPEDLTSLTGDDVLLMKSITYLPQSTAFLVLALHVAIYSLLYILLGFFFYRNWKYTLFRTLAHSSEQSQSFYQGRGKLMWLVGRWMINVKDFFSGSKDLSGDMKSGLDQNGLELELTENTPFVAVNGTKKKEGASKNSSSYSSTQNNYRTYSTEPSYHSGNNNFTSSSRNFTISHTNDRSKSAFDYDEYLIQQSKVKKERRN